MIFNIPHDEDIQEIKGSLNFQKTVTFTTSAITSTNPIVDSRFTTNTRLIGYQFYNSSGTPVGDILADLSTDTDTAGRCTVTLITGYAAGSVALKFGTMT